MNKILQLAFEFQKNTKICDDVPISLKEMDTIGVFSSYDDPIVITADVGGHKFGNLLVIKGSGTSILFFKCYQIMNP